MKKIFILLILSITIFSATAQTSKNGAYNLNVKTSPLVSNVAASEGIIGNITVYPNPVVEELKISFRSNERGTAIVSLFNNIGRPVFKQDADVDAGNNLISIDVKSRLIEPGVYFVQLLVGNQTITRKIIVK